MGLIGGKSAVLSVAEGEVWIAKLAGMRETNVEGDDLERTDAK